ncbi:hypothetical protein SDC9_190434 [bioreactor metagenome]|uniref:Uncharacterized protein n=1 Tax=bioreactor metagenome TaxID=1076179 RepID=A0A645HWB9_9ZZZZ
MAARFALPGSLLPLGAPVGRKGGNHPPRFLRQNRAAANGGKASDQIVFNGKGQVPGVRLPAAPKRPAQDFQCACIGKGAA